MVIFRSRAEGRVRVDMTAGTVQPNPISMGTMLRPDRPIFLSSLSMKKATRAMYPLSSSRDRKKNRITMMGRKLITLPTPWKIPSITRRRMVSFTFPAVMACSVRLLSQSMPPASRS